MTAAEEFFASIEGVRPFVQSPVAWCVLVGLFGAIFGFSAQSRNAVLIAASLPSGPPREALVASNLADFHRSFGIAFIIAIVSEALVALLLVAGRYWDWANEHIGSVAVSTPRVLVAACIVLLLHRIAARRYEREATSVLSVRPSLHPILLIRNREAQASRTRFVKRAEGTSRS